MKTFILLAMALCSSAAFACNDGATKLITENDMTYGDHGRDVQVPYVCIGGLWRRNGFVPQYPAACNNGATRQIIENDPTYGDHGIDKSVTYVCVQGVWRRNGYVPQYKGCKEGSFGSLPAEQNGRFVDVPAVCKGGKYVKMY